MIRESKISQNCNGIPFSHLSHITWHKEAVDEIEITRPTLTKSYHRFIWNNYHERKNHVTSLTGNADHVLFFFTKKSFLFCTKLQ